MTLPENIRTLTLFSGLTEKDKDSVLSCGRLRQIAQGATLFHQGDTITHFYLIVKGTLQRYRINSDGNKKTLDILKADQPFCETEVANGHRYYRTTATAVDNAVVMELPLGWLGESAKGHSSFAFNLMSLIARQAHMAELEAEHQASMSATQLIACFLQRMCVSYAFDCKKFELPYSKTLIASHLGMNLATFSRALARLKKHLTVKGRHFSIQDIERFGDSACGACSVAESCPARQTLKGKGRAQMPIQIGYAAPGQISISRAHFMQSGV